MTTTRSHSHKQTDEVEGRCSKLSNSYLPKKNSLIQKLKPHRRSSKKKLSSLKSKSVLRIRLMQNSGSADNNRNNTAAESELGFLRQRQTVTGLRMEQQPVESPSLQQQISSHPSDSQPQVAMHEEDAIQEQQHDLIDDPPSGGNLPSAYWGLPDMQIVEEDDLLDTEVVDPGTKGRRGINRAPKANRKRELRINVTLDTSGQFADKEANKVIGHRLKYFFDPRFTSWEKVRKSHRQLLWKEFGMACRWEAEINEAIAKQWNHVNCVKYREMMSQAKLLASEGFRSDWMQVRHYWICKRYWASPEFKNVSEQNQKNRGVEFDEAGKALKANPTHTGGQKSISERGDSLDAYAQTKKKGKRKVGEGSLTDGNNEGQPKEALSTEDNSQEEEWIDDRYQIIVERYLEILDKKYEDRPEERPTDSSPRDQAAWAKAVGGAKRGRIAGVSGLANPQLLGYPTTKRQSIHALNLEGNMSDISSNHMTSMKESLQKAMREETEKIREEAREEVKNELQKEKEKMHEDNELFKSDFLKQMQQQIQIALSGQQHQDKQVNVQVQRQEKTRIAKPKGNEEKAKRLRSSRK